jgi:hypothetical protein
VTAQEAKRLKVGTQVQWQPTGELGQVTEQIAAGIRVLWADGTEGIYLCQGEWASPFLDKVILPGKGPEQPG